MARSIIPEEQPPYGTDEKLSEYLDRMFKYARLSDELSDQLPILTSLPTKPLVGKLYYIAQPIPAANIAYEGIYIYKSDGRWWSIADIACGTSWRDNLASLAASRSVGTGTPTFLAINGGAQFPAMTIGPGTIILQTAHHIDHDIEQGGLFYPHVHWTNDVALLGGETITFDCQIQSAAGHDQAYFPAPALTQVNGTIAGARNQWRHFIHEATVGVSMPEVDSLVFVQTTLNTTTVPGNVIGLYVDLHYKMERLATVEKAPDFYV